MDEIADLGSMKALANPLRQRILRILRRGEATSTALARELGVTTGGTSYNLRVLARYGLIEEVPERNTGRERWWRLAGRGLRFPPRSQQGPEMRATLDELNERWTREYAEAYERFEAARADMGEWADAVPYSRGSVKVTLEELERFFEDYLALLSHYQRPEEEVPADAREVLTYFVAFPDVTDEPDDQGRYGGRSSPAGTD